MSYFAIRIKIDCCGVSSKGGCRVMLSGPFCYARASSVISVKNRLVAEISTYIFIFYHMLLLQPHLSILVGALEHVLFVHILGIKIPTDSCFFRGVAQPPAGCRFAVSSAWFEDSPVECRLTFRKKSCQIL